MKRVTYNWRDHLRIYWRAEFVPNFQRDGWDYGVLRRLGEDDRWSEVFHGWQDCILDSDPDLLLVLTELGRYYATVVPLWASQIEDFSPT